MRHRKRNLKLGRTSSHNRCMIANMLKSLINKERIKTTLAKAKVMRRYADGIITLAKNNTLANRRAVISKLMVRHNRLTSKQARQMKEGSKTAQNVDRGIVSKLFDVLGPRFINRQGGYTRIIPMMNRVGDNAPICILEFLNE
ncbi:MAG: 50S ribosomal protein L17 [Chlamydiales bacterium]